MESIVRSVLSYPSNPAVIITASFSLINNIRIGIDAHLSVAVYYDVPVCHILVPSAHPDGILSRQSGISSPIEIVTCLMGFSMRNSLLSIINKHPEMRRSKVLIIHFEFCC